MTGQRTTEHESNLGAWRVSERLDALGALNGATPAAEEPRFEAISFDTPDRRLLRRGVTVRFRPDAQPTVWTVTLPQDVPAIGLNRREISTPGELSEIPPLIADLVRGWTLGAPLAEVKTGEPADPPGDLEVPANKPAPTAGALIQAALMASAARLVDHVAAVVLDEDPEGVHQARVSIRRLRSDLRTAQPLLHFRSVRPLRRELDWLMDQLGEVRDLDVLLARLDSDACSFHPTDRAGADAVLAQVSQDRAQAYDRLLAALRSPRSAALLEETARLAAAPPFRDHQAARPAAEVLPRLVRRPLKELAREVQRQGNSPDDAGLHRIRISVKRVRYAAELAAPAAGRKADRVAVRLADVQRVLGEHHDACLAAARLRELGSRTGHPGTWAAGLLAGLQLARAARCRTRFASVWSRAAGKKRWRWTKR